MVHSLRNRRLLPPPEGRPAKGGKRTKIRASEEECNARKETLRSHWAVRCSGDGPSLILPFAFPVLQGRKRTKIRASEEECNARKETLRSHWAVRCSGDGPSLILPFAFPVLRGGKRTKIRASEEECKARKETLRSHWAVKCSRDADGVHGHGFADRVGQKPEEEKTKKQTKKRARSREDDPSGNESEGLQKVLQSAQVLTKQLQNLHEIYQECVQLGSLLSKENAVPQPSPPKDIDGEEESRSEMCEKKDCRILLVKKEDEYTGGEEADEDDECVLYEAYGVQQQLLGIDDSASSEDEQEMADLFQEMALALDNGWTQDPVKTRDNGLNGGCLHSFTLADDVGWVCEKCGFVGQDIQSVFLIQNKESAHGLTSIGGRLVQNPARLKKQASGLPLKEEEDAESKDCEKLLISKESLPRVTLRLHPYYEEHLHPHQKEGIMFLTKNLIGDAQSRVAPGGCILAHAPGTGKTCLTVSFVQSFLAAFPKGRPLIVAPKIMLKPWQQEFELWNVEDIPTYNLNESGTQWNKRSRKEQDDSSLVKVVSASKRVKERLEACRMKLIKKWFEERSIMLVSYNLFAILVLAGLNDEDAGSMKQQICQALLDGPELLIMDEGHFPRTKRTKISQALMRVRTQRKILLSGTLFQNNFKELFNVLKLARHSFMSLCPEFDTRLKSTHWKKPSSHDHSRFAGRTCNEVNLRGRECEEQMFMEQIGYRLEEFVQGAKNFEEINVALHKLRALTAPIVHWYPGQILKCLPGLCEFVVYLNLTAHQQQLYSYVKRRCSLEEKTRMAEVCIHPSLLKYEENIGQALLAPNAAHHTKQDPSEGGKTAFIFSLLRLCYISGERLLVFCQTLSPLSLLESMLSKQLGWSRGKEVLRLDGTMPSEERQSMIRQFNDESNKASIMLASITACKEGISLVGASRVVVLDVLYNPSVVRQAVSRAFRIGQKKKVYVYRLVAANTKEENIFQGAVQKDWLSGVLTDQSFRMSGNSFSAENILQIDKAPEDKFLQKMLQTDPCKRINRFRRYQSHFSSV